MDHTLWLNTANTNSTSTTNRYDDDTSWSMKETSSLLDLISKDEEWMNIAKNIGKTPQQCSDWFDYLEDISKHIPKRQKTKPFVQHRKRRKAAQIERLYKCQEKYCYRSYGTEGALKMHIKLKHPSVTYNENYQLQARNAAMVSESMLEEFDDEVSEEEQPQSQPLMKRQLTRSNSLPATNLMPFSHPQVTDPPLLCHQGVKRKFTQEYPDKEFHPFPENMFISPKVTSVPQPFMSQQKPSPIVMDHPLCDFGRRTSLVEPLPRVELRPMQINFICK